MTAYSVDDNKQYMRHFIQQLLRVLSLFAMWRANETILTSSSFLVPLLYLFLTALLLSVNGGEDLRKHDCEQFPGQTKQICSTSHEE